MDEANGRPTGREGLLTRVRAAGLDDGVARRIMDDLWPLLSRLDAFDDGWLQAIPPLLRPAAGKAGLMPADEASGSSRREAAGKREEKTAAPAGSRTETGAGNPPPASLPDDGPALPAPSLTGVAALLNAGQLSAVELLEVILARIRRCNPAINAYVHVDEEGARAAARASDQRRRAGNSLSPLDGIPVALKDIFLCNGMPTSGGSPLLMDLLPQEDGFAVARLRAAGAVVVGKTNTHEAALGTTTVNPHFGATRNPWDPARVAGGSSGGSAAALAAGLAYGATGSDTGGSIRIPAALCGVVGIKPTFGRVGRSGVVPLSWSLDHVGPMARTVEDVALLLEIMAGHDPHDPGSSVQDPLHVTPGLRQGVAGLRIGMPRRFFVEQLDPQVLEAYHRALEVLEALGARVVEVDWPSREEAEDILAVTTLIMSTEGAAWHEPLLRQHAHRYGDDVRHRLQMGLQVTAREYLKALRIGRWLQERLSRVFDAVDVVATPTCPVTAFPIGAREIQVLNMVVGAPASLSRFTRLANLTGWPAVSVPCARDRDGLPVGLQLMGRPWDETTLLRVAWAYEQERGVWFA